MGKNLVRVICFATFSCLLAVWPGETGMNMSGVPTLVLKAEAGESDANADRDGDGVPDDLDVCPDTPRMAKVDDLGCPLDTDGDGVDDYLDQCPDTPKLTKVDGKGCPVEAEKGSETHWVCCHEVLSDGTPVEFDTDRDGVLDFMDQCLGTPKGVRVDENGCWTSGEIYFAEDQWDIEEAYWPLLDDIAAVLEKDPNLRLEIHGHSDNRGSEAYQRTLSEKRADATVRYLLAHGIAPDRLKAKGLGATEPVESNATPESQARNRRASLIPIR
jgi:OOP family OmpA-OmpF porin